MEEEQSTPFASEDTALARAKGVGRKALASGLHFHRRRYPLSECSVLQHAILILACSSRRFLDFLIASCVIFLVCSRLILMFE